MLKEYNTNNTPLNIRLCKGIYIEPEKIAFIRHDEINYNFLEVLEYIGHKTLMETSVRAIEVSAPFKPLPVDFPEDYLEITAQFYYFNRDYK